MSVEILYVEGICIFILSFAIIVVAILQMSIS